MMPWGACKLILRNSSGATLPASGNKIWLGPVAVEH